MEGFTPHADAPKFLNENIIKSLQKIDAKYAQKNKVPFWITNVNLQNCQLLVNPNKEKNTGMDEVVPKDPITNEPLTGDSVFLITFAVNLGDPPTEAAPEQGQPGNTPPPSSPPTGQP
jgi:hypothetical protein